MRRRVLELLSQHGVLIEPAAADMLCQQPDPMSLIENYLITPETNTPMIITVKHLEDLLGTGRLLRVPEINILTKASRPKTGGEVRIIKDITGNSTCIGDIASFFKLFQNRYNVMKRLLMRRRELSAAVSLSKATKVGDNVRVIGMVKDVRLTKNGHRLIEIEDEEDSLPVLVLRDSRAFNDYVVNDEVIGVVGKVAKRGEMIVADEIIRPDVPVNTVTKRTDSTSWAVFVGDIHVGSDTFLENQWDSFIEWLNTAEDAKDVKYVIMPGDLVDGIGIYPEQEDELLIDDIYRQYEVLAESLKQIRDDITIIASPGNHDAVRLAEPQPALPENFSKFFDSNVKMVGNPAEIELEDRNILIYHGRSIDDWISTIPGLTYSKPLDVMKEMLKRRHLAPIYGERTAIAPEEKDYLVIDNVPDIFVTGHVHNAGMGDYRGVIMINASAWQAQTEFQRMHNHIPDPCKAFMVHLGSCRARVVKFN